MIPERMLPALNRYVKHGIVPGSFLYAVLCNDLKEAVACADDENIQQLPEYVRYLYNNVPSPCWGSVERVNAWIKDKNPNTSSPR